MFYLNRISIVNCYIWIDSDILLLHLYTEKLRIVGTYETKQKCLPFPVAHFIDFSREKSRRAFYMLDLLI